MSPHGRTRAALVGLAALGLGAVACLGDIPGEEGEPPPDEGPRQTTPPGAAPGGTSPAPDPGGLAWPVRYNGEPSALRRLSRDELVATLEMLTGSAPIRDDLPEDPRPGHGPLHLGGTPFIAAELGRLKQVMTDHAIRTAPALLMRSGCAATGQAQRDCLAAWSSKLAEQAFRRTLRSTEVGRLQKILELAGASREDDVAALQGVLTAIFQAPSFLYRAEIGTPVAGKTGVRALGGNEIATRLSFLATLAPPDAELLAAAKAGRLSDGAERARHLGRLLATERGKRALSVMVLEWLGANERKVYQKSAKYLSGLGTDFEVAIRASVEATIRKVLAEGAEPTVGALLSTDAYLADPAVQKVRQPAGSGRTASGDTAETARAGLMMHPHVLAAHTKEDGASPFQIGVFVREAFLCEVIPAAPPGATDMARTDVPAGLTLRESLDFRTGDGVCRACHQQFAPLGYAFLPFDPVGRWVRQDPTGKPWDLAGSISPSAGPELAFKSPGELMRDLAGRTQVHGCFAQAAAEWALGRGLVSEDQELVAALDEAARRSRGNVAAILQAIVSAPAFVNTILPR